MASCDRADTHQAQKQAALQTLHVFTQTKSDSSGDLCAQAIDPLVEQAKEGANAMDDSVLGSYQALLAATAGNSAVMADLMNNANAMVNNRPLPSRPSLGTSNPVLAGVSPMPTDPARDPLAPDPRHPGGDGGVVTGTPPPDQAVAASDGGSRPPGMSRPSPSGPPLRDPTIAEPGKPGRDQVNVTQAGSEEGLPKQLAGGSSSDLVSDHTASREGVSEDNKTSTIAAPVSAMRVRAPAATKVSLNSEVSPQMGPGLFHIVTQSYEVYVHTRHLPGLDRI